MRRPPFTTRKFLVLISVRGWVDPRALVRLEGLAQLRHAVALSGMEPATVRLVAQCLSQPTSSRPYSGIQFRHGVPADNKTASESRWNFSFCRTETGVLCQNFLLLSSPSHYHSLSSFCFAPVVKLSRNLFRVWSISSKSCKSFCTQGTVSWCFLPHAQPAHVTSVLDEGFMVIVGARYILLVSLALRTTFWATADSYVAAAREMNCHRWEC
jgi:hypothetical protein